nr:retrovirus-related Pol polyprotein from transposon TNT 1-94 [Tanacetum cinerariifolium]
MIGNLKLLINFFCKFLGTVRFGNDHIAAILGFGDLQWGNILITKVYFVEGLGHNFFSVGQFYDSDLKVAFRRNACFVRNLEDVDLLSGNRTTNLYTINLYEIAYVSPICLMARASSTKSWLWHQRLSHLNFDSINELAKNDLVFGLPKFKYHKEHLCPSCKQGKSKRASHPPKPVPNSRQRLHILHMDLCGPMRIASINGNRYVLVIVDDYSRYTWNNFPLPVKKVATARRKVKPLPVPASPSSTTTTNTTSGEKSGRTVTLTAKDMQKKKNDVKARTTLLLSLLEEHQLRFNGSESLEQTFNRLQVIISQLQFMDVEIEHDDLNQKFLTILAPEWLMHTIVWRNRGDLDTMSLDDLYNHLKVYESEVQKKSEPNSQNMAFISSAKHSSRNEDGNTACVPTASASVTTISQDIACAYIASQSSGSQIKFE